jgi:hypothetical protein
VRAYVSRNVIPGILRQRKEETQRSYHQVLHERTVWSPQIVEPSADTNWAPGSHVDVVW